MKNKREVLVKLFLSTLYLSAFTFGGGYVIVTLMKKKFVDDYHWIEENEMLDLVAIAQSAPGPIAVNGAILVGWKVYGFAGMVVAVIGTILPPMAILAVLSVCYAAFASNVWVAAALEGMRVGVAAVILDVSCGLGVNVLKEKKLYSIAIMIIAFLADFVLDVNVIYIIAAGILAGTIRFIWMRKREQTAGAV
mgnify:CR=1 FL=1